MPEAAVEVLRRCLAEHADDPSGTGVEAALGDLVSSGRLRGVRVRPIPAIVSHEVGELDADDVVAFPFAADSTIECTPAGAAAIIEPLLPVLTTTFLTGIAAARRIAEASPGPMAVRRADGAALAVNDAYTRLTGHAGATGLEQVHVEDRGLMVELLERLAEEDALTADARLLRPDGSVLPVRLEIAALRWPSGALRFVATHVRDLTELRELESRLEASDVFQRVLDEAPVPMALRDGELRLEWANEAYLELVGRSLDALRGTFPDELIDPRDYGPADRGALAWNDEDGRSVFESDLRYVRPDGSVRRVRTEAARLDLPGIGTKWLSFADDVTETRAREAENRQLRRRLETTLLHAPGVIAIYDRDAEIVFSSIGDDERASLRRLIERGELSVEVLDRTSAVIETGRPDRWTSVLGGPDAHRQRWFETSCAPIFDDEGQVDGAVAIAIDRTEQMEAEERLAYQATHDLLTGLLDRTGLLHGLGDLAPSNDLAVLFVDLDEFKDVNDTLGHDAGDELLQHVAARLRANVDADLLIARPGGDEFILVGPSLDLPEAMEIAETLLTALGQPYELGGASIPGSASIGVAAVPTGTTPLEALRRADVAMYEAKRRGRNRVASYDVGLEERLERRVQSTRGLRRALAGDELVVHYQPEYDLVSGDLLGAEALIRWDDPARGRLLSADEFIEVAEQSGLMGQIGRFVMASAARDAATWPDELLLRVNISARQLDEPGLLDMILGVLDGAGLAPSRLCVELTETALADGESLRRIHELSEAGIMLALDDFGTGFSSLALLRTLPVDVIKIDRSFVDGLGSDDDDTAIVRSIIGLADALDLEVVAEGVETATHVRLLRELGCRRAQGFGLDRPMPVEGLRRRWDRHVPELLTYVS